MSRGTVFRNASNLSNDMDFINCSNSQNDKYSKYQLSNLRPTSNYVNSMKEVGVYYDSKNTVRSDKIDEESKIKNGEKGNIITNNKDRSEKTLDPRLYTTMPYTGPGSGTVKMDVEDQVRRGELTNSRRSEKEQEFRSTFIPLIPEIQQAMGNVDHFVEKNWTRGGISTRSVKQNIDLVKSCGLRR